MPVVAALLPLLAEVAVEHYLQAVLTVALAALFALLADAGLWLGLGSR